MRRTGVNARNTGKAPPAVGQLSPNGANSKGSPAAMAKFIASCGYKVLDRGMRVAGGWMRFTVEERATGVAKGQRWVRPRSNEAPGYEVRKADPNADVRELALKCGQCGGPLEVVADGDDPPIDRCFRMRGLPDLGSGECCMTLVGKILEEG